MNFTNLVKNYKSILEQTIAGAYKDPEMLARHQKQALSLVASAEKITDAPIAPGADPKAEMRRRSIITARAQAIAGRLGLPTGKATSVGDPVSGPGGQIQVVFAPSNGYNPRKISVRKFNPSGTAISGISSQVSSKATAAKLSPSRAAAGIRRMNIAAGAPLGFGMPRG